MNKKIFLSILLLTLICLCTTCFATDLGSEVQDSMNKSWETMQNVGEGERNVASDIVTWDEVAVLSVGNGIRDVATGIGNGVPYMFDRKWW